MSEENSIINKPKKLWNDALRMVKGDNNNQLVEQFTAEMTLVAEGLCEDQNKLRGEVDQMLTTIDRRIQKLDSRIGETVSVLEEQQRENDQVTTELRERITALERQNAREAKEAREAARAEEAARKKNEKKNERNRIRDITILIVVAAIAVIAVTLVIKLV